MQDDSEDILIKQGVKRAIHTVNQDISSALSGSSARTVKKAIETAKDQELLKQERTLSLSINKMWFILTMVLLVGSAGVLIWGIETKNNSLAVDPILTYQGLITYDQTKVIGDFEPKASLMNQKFKDADKEVAQTGITRFRFKNVDPVSSTNLIKAFEWKLSSTFSSGLESAFDFGVYQTKTTDGTVNSPFVLFKTNGSDQSFAGFSMWESNVLFDLGQIFNINAKTALDPIYQKKFTNITIESHDGRALYDDNGNPLIIMIFIDENHALVTNSKQAVVEILKRVILKK